MAKANLLAPIINTPLASGSATFSHLAKILAVRLCRITVPHYNHKDQ